MFFLLGSNEAGAQERQTVPGGRRAAVLSLFDRLAGEVEGATNPDQIKELRRRLQNLPEGELPPAEEAPPLGKAAMLLLFGERGDPYLVFCVEGMYAPKYGGAWDCPMRNALGSLSPEEVEAVRPRLPGFDFDRGPLLYSRRFP